MRLWTNAFLITIAAAATAAAPARAADLTLSGTLSSSCTLTIGRHGTLALAASGTSMATTESGGQSGIVNVVFVGAPAQISFSAVTLSASPAGWGATHSETLTLSSAGGASATATSSAYQYTPSGLIDSVTVHGVLNAAAGFKAGTYTLSTTVTCS